MDPDADLSDELLALAGESGHNQKHSNKRKGGPSTSGKSKRRKQQVSDSEDGPESEEEEVAFPLEGKYIDEKDRERLMSLSETKREEILSSRLEQKEASMDRKNLDRFYQSQQAGGREAPENVSKAAKRKHTAPGATKEKSSKLEELKQKRKAQASRRARNAAAGGSSSPPSPSKHRRSETPSSSSDDEEGQIYQRKDDGSSTVDTAANKVADGELTKADLSLVKISRVALEKYCMDQWFEDYVKGGWVKVAVGPDDNNVMQYRLGEVTDVVTSPQPYKLGLKMVKQVLDVKHGEAARHFRMDEISSRDFTDREFDRIVSVFKVGKLKLPTKAKLEKKAEQMKKIESRTYTEADIAYALERQKQINNQPTEKQIVFQKARLRQSLTLAYKRNDAREIAHLQEELAAFDKSIGQAANNASSNTPTASTTPSATPSTPTPAPPQKDIAALINERNRNKNQESVRKFEYQAMLRKKALAEGGAQDVIDLSARVKTVPKLRDDSRAGTPGLSVESLSVNPNADINDAATGTSVSSLNGLDALARSVTLDLGDF